MKKTLVFLVLLAILLPSGWMDPQSGAAWQGEISSAKSTGVKMAAQEDQALTVPTDLTNPLFPTDMDPISTCQASLGGPFGKDVEIFMGGDVGYRIDMIPEWKSGGTTPFPTSVSNISAVATSSENIVAVWKANTNHVWFDLWQTSVTYPDGAWVGSVDLGFQADGDPTIIAKSEFQYEVYARKGSNIYTTILTDTLDANKTTSSARVQIEGVNNAASDPVVIAVNPNHTAIFYLDAAGRVWFTEWNGGWEWRDKPIPLIDSWRAYLPLAMTPQSGSLGFPGAIIAPSSGSEVHSASQNFQFLNAIARNDNHMAVFAVDTDNQLWVREWTRSSTDDWSNTHWVKLMEGVALEKPGITSRHSNNIGVVVRDISGNPFYIEWSNQTGWTSPTSLPLPANGVLSSAFTLVAMGSDAYWLFAIDQTGQIRELIWSENAGWGEWGTIDLLVN